MTLNFYYSVDNVVVMSLFWLRADLINVIDKKNVHTYINKTKRTINIYM